MEPTTQEVRVLILVPARVHLEHIPLEVHQVLTLVALHLLVPILVVRLVALVIQECYLQIDCPTALIMF